MSKSKIKLVFSDIDNTLIHNSIIGKFLPIIGEDRIISRRAITIIYEIGQLGIPFILITGRRISSFKKIMNYVPHAGAILEHGCIIYKENKIDAAFAQLFVDYIGDPNHPQNQGLLWEYKKDLEAKGYTLDAKGRTASFRIDPAQNNLSKTEEQELLTMKHPYGLKAVSNTGFIDFIPPMGGKDQAIEYLIKSLGSDWKHIACLGDDYNDVEMLSKAGYPFTHSSARPEVINLVGQRKGYISPYKDHHGTIDMLVRLHEFCKL
jgi:HAD superfamily hydrolase (TIGR01484 family)